MNIDDIDTPAVLIDLDIVERNLRSAQDYANQHGLNLRPHVKTHKLPRFARAQAALGAVGITAQKLGEAEAMADGGVTDIFLPYNILGLRKLARLKALHGRVTLSVTMDSQTTLNGYAETFSDTARPLTVLVECDTGAGRCGVQTADDAVTLARAISAHPGLRYGGLMVYPKRGDPAGTQAWLTTTIAALTTANLPPPVVSTGGTPDFLRAAEVTHATEHRPGTYIYNDRMQVGWGHGTWDDCAMTVLTTVVSRPTETRAILDAGSKALAADPVPAGGHGRITTYPDAIITALNEEHAMVDLTACPDRPRIGDRLRVIPNHACVVTNLFDCVYLMRGTEVEQVADVTSRGKLT
ncbi:MAG: D-TA family PLP-dependent enzyme [Rhodobacterales bacterium]|nr:D-TA family PLP-dependent enzyme [Rhodobacterales bacterium]